MSEPAEILPVPVEAPTEEPTELCPWCERDRTLTEWYGKDLESWSPDEGPVVCAECRANPPDGDEVLHKLPVKHRKILKSLMAGRGFYQAARDAGVHPSYPGNLIRNRGNQGGAAVREAFNLLLEMEGLDIFSIARQTRLLFHAKKPLWNQSKGDWDWFPDNSTRLGLLRHLTKLTNIDPPKDQGAKTAPISVNIQTNLGGEGPGDAPGTFTVEVGGGPPEGE